MERWIEERTGLRLGPDGACFGCEDTAELLEAVREAGPLEVVPGGFATAWSADAARVVVSLPPLQRDESLDPEALLERLEDPLGLHAVVLLQAGAAALGLFEEGRMFVHKTLKKYVVRGNGRAQPSYLESRGKSRYGSRLRLRNARNLLEQINERLTDWRDGIGEPERLYYGASVRTWAALFETRVAPPFPRDRFERVGLDLRVPSLAELERVYAFLGSGRIGLERKGG